MSTIKLENIQTRTGSGTITIGASGETVEVASGVTTNLKNGATLSDNILFDTASKGIYLGVTTATASNLLDDYEEGTWTIALQGSSSNPTVGYNFRVGTYIKVGKNVTLNGHFRTSSVSGGSGTVLITGLPFAVDNTSSYTTVGVCYMFNTATSKYPYYVRLNNGGTSLVLYYGSGTVQSTSFGVADLGTGNFNNETAFTINYIST